MHSCKHLELSSRLLQASGISTGPMYRTRTEALVKFVAEGVGEDLEEMDSRLCSLIPNELRCPFCSGIDDLC